MIILGIGGVLNDAAAAVLKDGELAGAVEQKKVARRARAGELPEEAIAASLRLAGSPRTMSIVSPSCGRSRPGPRPRCI